MELTDITDKEKYMLLAGFIYGALSDSSEFHAKFYKEDAVKLLNKVGFLED